MALPASSIILSSFPFNKPRQQALFSFHSSNDDIVIKELTFDNLPYLRYRMSLSPNTSTDK